MTSKWRRIDVVTSHCRRYDVMCLLGIWPPLAPQYSKPSYAYVYVLHSLSFLDMESGCNTNLFFLFIDLVHFQDDLESYVFWKQ